MGKNSSHNKMNLNEKVEDWRRIHKKMNILRHERLFGENEETEKMFKEVNDELKNYNQKYKERYNILQEPR